MLERLVETFCAAFSLAKCANYFTDAGYRIG
jgi:hypothetical protein